MGTAFPTMALDPPSQEPPGLQGGVEIDGVQGKRPDTGKRALRALGGHGAARAKRALTPPLMEEGSIVRLPSPSVCCLSPGGLLVLRQVSNNAPHQMWFDHLTEKPVERLL